MGFPNHVCCSREDQDHVVSMFDRCGDRRRVCVRPSSPVPASVRKRRVRWSADVLRYEGRLLPGPSGLLLECGGKARCRRCSRPESSCSADASGQRSADLLPQKRLLLPGTSAVLPPSCQRRDQGLGRRRNTRDRFDPRGRQADMLCQAGVLLRAEETVLPIDGPPGLKPAGVKLARIASEWDAWPHRWRFGFVS